MTIRTHIPLNRLFSPVPKSLEELESSEALFSFGHAKLETWDDLNKKFRCIILAEAGAGKTEELKYHARILASQGKPSFFIRIEDIEADFCRAFEVGSEAQYLEWLQLTNEAWFFLDSVDEARLENPRAFDKALRRFAKGIEKGAHRAHIYVSSRPYAWRPKEDRSLLDEILFLAAQDGENDDESIDNKFDPKSSLAVYVMRPLDEERVWQFCYSREIPDVDRLLQEIKRNNLWSLAERPFDLEGILVKWKEDKALGSRLDMLRHNIEKRLCDYHNSDRSQRRSLTQENAREGARRLAAAVLLTGKVGINVPDSAPVKPGIEAGTILSDWDGRDVRELLELGIFNDVIFGAVRFRHRDVRELLAAEWFADLLRSGNSRHSVEELFFQEKYGQKIITPRLRPVLPWLILLDDEVRHRALEISPELAVEDGDPSRLPIVERKRILANIVRRIVSDEDDRTARDNSAIARIAAPDLSDDTLSLIGKYGSNDDAIFFLGRLVWQGEMKSCVPCFSDIATDSSRGVYARVASIRAVMTCGTTEHKWALWNSLNECDSEIPRELLAEIVNNANPDYKSVEHLVRSIDKLPTYKRLKSTGLGHSLHGFIERLSIEHNQQVGAQLLDGFYGYLNRPPHIERGECQVSESYAWLLGPAIHLVEELVKTRSPVALGATALSIMIMAPALRFWRNGDFNDHKDNLPALVPLWSDLNDALYWACIEQARTSRYLKSNKPVTDDWSISWLGHFWKFDNKSLPRLLDYICSRKHQDDKLVALNAAFRIYVQADRPAHILRSLKDATANVPILQQGLDSLLNPPVSDDMRSYEEENAKHTRAREERDKQFKQARDAWIADVRANPDRVSNPPSLEPGEWSNDQYWLWQEIQDVSLKTRRTEGANWQALLPDFGDAVARAYRAAAIKHWRKYVPTLQSEGVIRNNSTPCELIFAMAGLEIESMESTDFPSSLNESEIRHALRYLTWELNGFPSWFEKMHLAYPALANEAVVNELLWELENTGADEPLHYILHDICYCASWLHESIAPTLFAWMERHPSRTKANRYYCLPILANGRTDPTKLAELARREIGQANDLDSIASWYALLIDCEPAEGIPKIECWLATLSDDEAKHAAQIFITSLVGGRHARFSCSNIGRFRSAEHLKPLYILMHRYIRANEDVDRTNRGVYSPGLRDDAQDARNKLFTLLSEIPGKSSYIAISQLIHEHPDPTYRHWMAKRAYKRAEEDGDLKPWTAEQVSAFNKHQTIAPLTHNQLFSLAVQRLRDLKKWLESGNDSAWKTWQRAEDETEMRTLIASWLNQQCKIQYTTAQEPELANNQRMDIWLHNTSVRSPVPIELKLLDKGWTGPKLCERLRNQLVGDYLREESAGCGVMLLVSQKIGPEKRWIINNKRVGLAELASALKSYWDSIAEEHPGVENVDVIVIDLAQRGNASNS